MAASNDFPAFEMTRRYPRPRAAVWQAFSEPEQLRQWWGPAGCTVDIERFEFRPGGFCHYAMRFDGVPTMWGRFHYREIVEPERLVWLNAFANERGGIARAPFSPSCPMEIENTVVLTEDGGVTTLSLRARPFGELDEERDYFDQLRPSLDQGYGGTFDQLATFLKTT